MDSPSVIVAKVAYEDPPQVPLVEHNDVVEALSADCPDQPLDVWTLPRASGGDEHVLETHVRDTPLESESIDPITVAQQVLGW
jgi:hypothetical protein